MSGATRIQLSEDWDRQPTEQELRNAPILTQAEMTEIMKSAEYKSSKLVQRLVAASIAKSNHSAPSQENEVQTGDEIAAKHATMKSLFNDPQYKTDAAYRYEVQQKLQAITANDNAPLAGVNLKTSGATVSIGLSSSPYHGADLRASRVTRVVSAVDMTGPEAPKHSKPKQTPEDVANS